MNTLPNMYKLFRFNLTVPPLSPLYLVKLKRTQKQLTAAITAMHSVEPIVPNFRRKSFNVRFFPHLLENSFGSSLTVNLLHSHRVLSKNFLQTQYGKF